MSSIPSPRTTLPAAPPAAPTPATRITRITRIWPAWLREPLLHFVLIGAALFAADHVLVGRSDDPRTILMGPAVDKEARDLFRASRGREPDADELKALRQVWLDNEVLFREGMALQVDRGDTAIRDRVIFKALSLVDANIRLPSISDEVLRAWFEKNRAKYDEPVRYDFEEAVLAGEDLGQAKDKGESAARSFADALATGTPGDAKAGLRVFKGRPHSNLVQSYGAEFAAGLEALPTGQWRALATRDGWRVMRLGAVGAARPAVFETVRPAVLQDWTDAVMAEQRSAAVRTLAGKYRIVVTSEQP